MKINWCKWWRHQWKTFLLSDSSIVYTRRVCQRCPMAQLQHNGPFGDQKWHLESEPFTFEHERESYKRALANQDQSQKNN